MRPWREESAAKLRELDAAAKADPLDDDDKAEAAAAAAAADDGAVVAALDINASTCGTVVGTTTHYPPRHRHAFWPLVS